MKDTWLFTKIAEMESAGKSLTAPENADGLVDIQNHLKERSSKIKDEKVGKSVAIVDKKVNMTIYCSLKEASEAVSEARAFIKSSEYLRHRIKKGIELKDGSRAYWFENGKIVN